MFSLHQPRFFTRLWRVQKDIWCKAPGRGSGGWSKGSFSTLLVALEELAPAGLHRLADALASNETQPVVVMVEV